MTIMRFHDKKIYYCEVKKRLQGKQLIKCFLYEFKRLTR